jgi:hypothetical protein
LRLQVSQNGVGMGMRATPKGPAHSDGIVEDEDRQARLSVIMSRMVMLSGM